MPRVAGTNRMCSEMMSRLSEERGPARRHGVAVGARLGTGWLARPPWYLQHEGSRIIDFAEMGCC